MILKLSKYFFVVLIAEGTSFFMTDDDKTPPARKRTPFPLLEKKMEF
jgi:hypothetical protein